MIGNSCFTAQLSGMLWNKRKIAEIGVGEQAVQPFQLLRKIIELLAELLNLRQIAQ